MRPAIIRLGAQALVLLAPSLCGGAGAAPSLAVPPPSFALQSAPSLQKPLGRQLRELLSGEGRKDPAISLLLAAVPPLVSIQGLGQVYNGEIGKGLLFFGLGQVSMGTWSTAVDEKSARMAIAVYIGSWIWSAIDAYRSARRINRQRGYGAAGWGFFSRTCTEIAVVHCRRRTIWIY